MCGIRYYVNRSTCVTLDTLNLYPGHKMEFKYPRVSEILEPYSNISLANVPKHYLQNACLRGTTIHSYAIAYARGDFVPSIDAEYEPYLDSFIQWYDDSVSHLIFSETRLYHDGLEFCGQPDLIVQLKGSEDRVLIDLKTATQIYQTYPVQLAAYMDLCNVHSLKCSKGIILKLRKDGKIAKSYDYADCNPYFKIFLSAVELYNYFLRPKKKRGSL